MSEQELAAAVARLKAARTLVWGEAPHTQRITISDHIDAAITTLEAAQSGPPDPYTRVCPIKDIACSTPVECGRMPFGCKLDNLPPAWTQSAATPSTSVGDDAQHGAAQAVTDGPPADPIDRVLTLTAKAEIERLRAERAEAERDTLREVVRAAVEIASRICAASDGIGVINAVAELRPMLPKMRGVLYDLDAARAKVTP